MIEGIIKGQELRIITPTIVSDTINYLTARFRFSDDWNGAEKWAHFEQGASNFEVKLENDEITADKGLNLTHGKWAVYVHGNRFAGGQVTERITTEVKEICVKKTGITDGDPFPDVEASEVERINAELEAVKAGKMEYYILTFDGTAFRHDGAALTFAQIREKCLDTKNFVYAQYENRLYIPAYVSGSNVFFDSAFIQSDVCKMNRISISSSNTVTRVDKVLATNEVYTQIAAVQETVATMRSEVDVLKQDLVTVDRSINIERLIPYRNITRNIGYFNENGFTAVTEKYEHAVIAVNPGDTLKFRYDQNTRYAVLTEYTAPTKNGDPIHFTADSALSGAKNLNGGIVAEITMPDDARYFIVATKYNGNVFRVKMFEINGSDERKSVNEKIGDVRTEMNELTDAVSEFHSKITNNDIIDDTSNKYLSTDLIEKPHANWMLTDYLPISEGTTVYYAAHMATSAISISFYDDSKLNIANGNITGSTYVEGSCISPQRSAYVRFCFSKYYSMEKDENQYARYISAPRTNASDDVSEVTILCDESLLAYYVDGGGQMKPGGPNWRCSEAIRIVPGTIIEYNVRTASSGNAVSFFDHSEGFISAVRTDSQTLTTVSGTVVAPQGSEFVRIGMNRYGTDEDRASQYAKFEISESAIKDADIQNRFNIDGASPLCCFNNVLCIGDSLTYSIVASSTEYGTSRQAYKPYPKVLSDYLGYDGYKIVAVSGATARDMWVTKASEITSAPNQLAIIYLGTNAGLTDTVDTDCPAGEAYTSFADNNTGSYGKIIAKCQELGCKVLLLRIYYRAGYRAETNAAIDHLAERFGCAVMDAPDGTMYNSLTLWPNHGGTGYPHYNDLGYSWFARKLADSAVVGCGKSLKYLII